MARIVKTRIELWDAGMFPVMTGKDYGREEGACVPLSLVLPHERQADRNHGQTLHRLAERGGLSACELAAVLEDREWHSMPEHEGWAAIFRAAVKAMPTEEASSPEGCTPTDARVLREANGIFAEENHQLRRTLRFYAHGEHYTGLKHWEGPSGDDNWLCPPGEDYGDYRKQFIDAMDEAMVEDGTLARSALRGVYLNMDGEPELAPVEGEPEWKIEQEAKALLSPQRQITPADAKTRHYLDGQNYDADPAFGDD